jgi:hypothetical protein
MAVAAQFIDKYWNYHRVLLDFICDEESHTADHIFKILYNTADKYEITDKIDFIVTKNVQNIACKKLKTWMEDQ